MSADSASPERRRAAAYKALAVAFSYPDEALAAVYPDWAGRLGELQAAYDRVFRAGVVWLYGAEHATENEFQRVAMLADIMGFYNAFGVEPRGDRPDALGSELEFMHYLIVQRARLRDLAPDATGDAKAAVCDEAQRKFFTEHLAPAARSIANGILAAAPHPFYVEAAGALNDWIDRERNQWEANAA
jgi:TorA maturation chaperone TorD